MTVAEIYERVKDAENYEPNKIGWPIVEALWEIALQLAEMNQREAAKEPKTFSEGTYWACLCGFDNFYSTAPTNCSRCGAINFSSK